MFNPETSRIARVFPRRTAATPDDALAFVGEPPLTLLDVDEAHISVTFSYDIQEAEYLAGAWTKAGYRVKLGGPALGMPGGDFMPGLYLKRGYVITSRGCPNIGGGCWFCSVPAREGGLRELPITDGYDILDDNLLACSEKHIREVFAMLKRQEQRPEFTGGLEARRLKEWHVDLLREVKTARMYFAYDTPDDLEPLIAAGKLLQAGGFAPTAHRTYCYVLCGYSGDTFEHAEKRLRDAWAAGFFPFAMLYMDKKGTTQSKEWKKFQKEWVRPQIVGTKLKETNNNTMNKLILYQEKLPDNIKELQKYVLFGREAIGVLRAEIRAIDKLKLATDVKEQKLAEAQALAEVVLDSEAKIGELLKAVPAVKNNQYTKVEGVNGDTEQTPKQKSQSAVGINKQQAIRFMKLANNIEVIEEAKAEARNSGDILTRSIVLEKIRSAERKAARQVIETHEPKPFNGKYSVILADCPWRYDWSPTTSRAVENKYPTMSIEDIKAIQIPAEDDAILFLWATAPKLPEALEVMAAWGFVYKTCTVWDKMKLGTGFYFRGQHELLLVGTRGNFKVPTESVRVSSVYREARTEHSVKPTYYYDLIEKYFPNERYLELFARRQYNSKWAVWGNQV
jgi:N6-adenosine-specific RNA methylase IME4